MTIKRIYNLKSQRITERHENLSKMCVCIFLVLFVLCGIILTTVYFVKSANSKEKFGQINYHDGGNNENLKPNKRLIQHLDVRNDYFQSNVGGKTATTSNTAEYTSTTIESPLSTSTMSSVNVPPRFLIVNTVSAIGVSNSDYSTAGSENDFVRISTKGGYDKNPSLVKRSTNEDFMYYDQSLAEEDYFDAHMQWISMMLNEEPISTTLTNENSTPKTKLKAKDKQQTCNTNACKQSTSRMLALLNHTAEPCSDFYSYACGGFEMNHFGELSVSDTVLESLPDVSTLEVTVPYKKLYHDFFISCANYKNGRGLKEVSKLLYDLCQNHKENLTDLIGDIIMLHPQKSLSRLLPLFDVVMEVGPQKTLIPTVSLPKLNSLLSEDDNKDLYEQSCLNLAEMGTKDKKNKEEIQGKYKECIDNQNEYFKNLEKSIILLQIFEHLPEFGKKQMIKKTVQFIEQKIIDKFGYISDAELKSAKYETVALNWLNSAYPTIEWNKLFEKLFGIDVAKNITEVHLKHSTYLVKIFDFYSSHSFEDIKTSILSMMAHDMYIDFIEPLSSNDRYKYCLNVATKLMPDIASMLYLENFSPSDILYAEQKVKLMFDQLILTFNASLNENIWLNENVRKEVSNKISQLNVISNPYAGFINFKENFHKLYSNVNITTNDYISNAFALKQVVRRRMYNTYGRSVSPEIIWNYLAWPISSSPVRITETTAIVLPTSLISKITSGTQKIEEFSTIGFLVAQEISRFLYTDETSNLFINGNEDFKANVEIHLQDPAYSKKPNIYGIRLDDKDISASQHSRFIDDVALRVTFDAYDQFQSPFDNLMPWTDEPISKIFYLLTSQQFCNAKKSSVEVAINLIRSANLPNYFRVNSMMMNSESFLSTFEC